MKLANTNNKVDVVSMECKKCGYQFTPTLHKGFDEKIKLTACLLYINRLSLKTIAKLLNTSATSVLSWTKKFALLNYEKPKSVFQNITV